MFRLCRFASFPHILAFALGAAHVGMGVFAARADETASVRQFVQMRWPVSGRMTPSGDFYYIHNPDGLNQLYLRRAGSKDATKLTDFPDGMSDYTMSDDGKHIIVAAGVGGNEQTSLYLLDMAAGRMRALYAHPDIVYGSVVWRRDSMAFAFKSNDISPADFYVYIYDLAANRTQRVYSDKGDVSPADFSSDGKRLIVYKTHSVSHSQLFEINLDTLKYKEITPAGEKWSFEPIGYDAKDKLFYAASNYKGDKTAFVTIDTTTGRIDKPFPQYADFEADSAEWKPDRSMIALTLNEDGYRTLRLWSMSDRRELKTPRMDKGLIGGFQFVGDDMIFSLENARTPGTIYRWSPDEPDAAPVALTQPDTRGIDVSKFLLPQLVKYESFDGLEVPAFLYLPEGYQKGTKIPFVIEYHGGPEGQYRPSFNRIFQYLLSHGYGILAPNVRGSSGYGMKYLEMDNYKKRMDSVRDGVAAAKWLVDEGYSTPKQIAALGGSYGGFMVMAVLTEAPEMFGAGCNIVGICNMRTFLERTKDYRRKLREVEYGPLTDPDFLKSVSPIYKAERIKAPLLIAHGENDPRVPVYEARQLYDKMMKLNKPVEIIVFPDEGHGFRKENNRITFYEKLTAFFDQHLKD